MTNFAGLTHASASVVDGRARVEHARSAYLDRADTTASELETVVDEPSDSGAAQLLNKFWAGWTTVASNPTSPQAGIDLLHRAAAVISALRSASSALDAQQEAAVSRLAGTVVSAGANAGRLAEVNRAIAVGTATGVDTNTLADQRDALTASLAESLGGRTTLQPDGTATVLVGGRTIVAGGTAATLGVDASNAITVDASAATLGGGSAGALVDALSGSIPQVRAELDAVAAALAGTVNAAHQAGYDTTGTPGQTFFAGTTAATIQVAITDPATVAAAATASNGGNRDGGQAAALAGFGTLTDGADARYRELVNGLGSRSAAAAQQAAVQSSVTEAVDAQRASASGVDLDEEVGRMLTYQRAYQAASRVLTTVDENLDILINHAGRVGL